MVSPDFPERTKAMSTIPKRVRDRFVKSVPKFQKVLQIAKDRDVNESDTVSILTDILCDVFGYDKYVELTSEFAIRGTYCDLAVKIDGKVQFLLEAKAIGIDLKESHMRQATNYAANHGMQWVVLTNGVEWRLHRLRFEKPIDHDLVCSFNFFALNPRAEKDQECLFLLSKEGLAKDVREDYFEKVQSVNRFVIGGLILSDPVLNVVRRELRKFSEGVRIDLEEVEEIIRTEVLKRELVEGEEAEVAHARIARFYKKRTTRQRAKKSKEKSTSAEPEEDMSLSDRLLRESETDDQAAT